jgi:hypothetical protein
MQRGCILSLLVASQCFRELRLNMAAKHYALAAAHIIQRQDDLDLYPQALFQVAVADFHQGAWLTASEVNRLAMQSHVAFSENPYEFSEHSSLNWSLFEYAVMRGVAERFDESLKERIESDCKNAGLMPILEEFLSDFDQEPWWLTRSPEELIRHLFSEIGAPPFSDTGNRRMIEWSALGVTWQVEFPNDRPNTIAAERLAAIAQVAIAHFSLADPCFVPMTVLWKVKVTDSVPPDDAPFSFEETHEGLICDVSLSLVTSIDREAIDTAVQSCLATVVATMLHVSALPPQTFMELVKQHGGDDLGDRVSIGMLYDLGIDPFSWTRGSSS